MEAVVKVRPNLELPLKDEDRNKVLLIMREAMDILEIAFIKGNFVRIDGRKKAGREFRSRMAKGLHVDMVDLAHKSPDEFRQWAHDGVFRVCTVGAMQLSRVINNGEVDSWPDSQDPYVKVAVAAVAWAIRGRSAGTAARQIVTGTNDRTDTRGRHMVELVAKAIIAIAEKRDDEVFALV